METTRATPTTKDTGIFEILKEVFGEEKHLLDYIPVDAVVMIAHDDRNGYVPHKISLGFVETKRGRIEVFAYMATTSHGKDIPVIHFFGRHPSGALRTFHQEDVPIEGQLHHPFSEIEDMGTYPILILLQYLFVAKGVKIPTDACFATNFYTHLRAVCCRFKNNLEKIIESTATGTGDSSNTSADKLGLNAKPIERLTPAHPFDAMELDQPMPSNAIIKTGKRSFSNFIDLTDDRKSVTPAPPLTSPQAKKVWLNLGAKTQEAGAGHEDEALAGPFDQRSSTKKVSSSPDSKDTATKVDGDPGLTLEHQFKDTIDRLKNHFENELKKVKDSQQSEVEALRMQVVMQERVRMYKTVHPATELWENLRRVMFSIEYAEQCNVEPHVNTLQARIMLEADLERQREYLLSRCETDLEKETMSKILEKELSLAQGGDFWAPEA